MKTLTKQELKRQDFVDNEIFQLIQKLFPKNARLEWNIEVIGAVRDVIQNQIAEQTNNNNIRFYP